MPIMNITYSSGNIRLFKKFDFISFERYDKSKRNNNYIFQAPTSVNYILCKIRCARSKLTIKFLIKPKKINIPIKLDALA